MTLCLKRLLFDSVPPIMEKLANQRHTSNREVAHVNQATNPSNNEMTYFQPEMEKAFGKQGHSTLPSPRISTAINIASIHKDGDEPIP